MKILKQVQRPSRMIIPSGRVVVDVVAKAVAAMAGAVNEVETPAACGCKIGCT
jgi:hypothetical protein